MPPEHDIPVNGVTTPSSRAPVATATLNVDPGGNCPCTARLFSGCFLSWTSARHSSRRIPRANTFGSYAGCETVPSFTYGEITMSGTRGPRPNWSTPGGGT